jgi:hypothetical protein
MLKETLKGVLIAGSVASLLTGGVALAKKDKSKTVMCSGVNECKGKGECAGGDASCKGKNDCKGKGNMKMKAEKDCTDKGGTVVVAKK